MEITEVRIKLMEDPGERLQGFCSITFDHCFVIRDLKIIEGTSGPFVAMPSRKLTSHCPHCNCKNHLRAIYCNQCGARFRDERALKADDGRVKLYADIAHPINSSCREIIQERVIQEFREECQRATQPGYVSRYDDFDEEPPPPNMKRVADAKPAIRSARLAGDTDAAARKPQADSSPRRSPDTNSVEPAESKPRGPHRGPPQTSDPHAPDPPNSGEFGAGIW